MSRLSEKRSRSDDQPEEQRTKGGKGPSPACGLPSKLIIIINDWIGFGLAVHLLLSRREVGGGFFFWQQNYQLELLSPSQFPSRY